MSVSTPVGSDHQLARLLQIGMVLEEVVEARANKHHETLEDVPEDVVDLLEEAAEESAEHRRRLEELIGELEADTNTDGVLYDQLASEETAYKFYDDLIGAIENSDVRFGIDRDRLLGVLREIRADEEAGVEAVTRLMETRE